MLSEISIYNIYYTYSCRMAHILFKIPRDLLSHYYENANVAVWKYIIMGTETSAKLHEVASDYNVDWFYLLHLSS